MELLGYCIDYDHDTSFEELKEGCLLLNEYITEGRYPGDLPYENITERDAIEAIEAADKIENFVLEKINFPFDDEPDQSNLKFS
jgi:HEPN domain-containing protein